MTSPLTGKVALVTGGGRGIGRGIALRLARDGADIALVDVRPDGINAVADEVGETRLEGHHLRRRRHRPRRRCSQPWSTPRPRWAVSTSWSTTPVSRWSVRSSTSLPRRSARIWAINVDGVLWGIQAAVAKFKELGRRGKIINASSIAGHDGFAMLGVYCATQVRGAGADPGRGQGARADGITVNAYCPGVVGTDMWVEIDKRFAELTGAAEGETYDKFVDGIALGRAETPEDVAGFVVLPGRPGRGLHDRPVRPDRRRTGLPVTRRLVVGGSCNVPATLWRQ